jgi:GDP-L-fucose synthase
MDIYFSSAQDDKPFDSKAYLSGQVLIGSYTYAGSLCCRLYSKHEKILIGSFCSILIVKCINAIENKEDNIDLLGTGSPLRQQLYVDDLAKLIQVIYQYYSMPYPIIVAHPDNLSIKEIAETVARVTGYKGRFTFNGQLDGKFRKDGSIQLLLSFLKENNIDFEFTSLEQGLQRTVEWYLNKSR